jgi:ATP-dependent Lon protease
VRYYTREAGVRNLEREIAKICRKVVKQLLLAKKAQPGNVTAKNLDKYLGVKRFRYGKAEEDDRIGQVTGLAWTEVGGELLTIEAAVVPGKGKLTVHRPARRRDAGIDPGRDDGGAQPRERARHRARISTRSYDVHIHVPEGATPKDGPSAGIGMCTALVSALTGDPGALGCRDDRRDHAARRGAADRRPEGEAARGAPRRHRQVLIPSDNEKDLAEIPKNIKDKLDIRPVKWIDEVLELALRASRPAVARRNRRSWSGRSQEAAGAEKRDSAHEADADPGRRRGRSRGPGTPGKRPGAGPRGFSAPPRKGA